MVSGLDGLLYDSRLMKQVQIVAIMCNQWGDSGKGKFGDFFSDWADVSGRSQGGDNAGHTVVINHKAMVFHLIPTGIIHDGIGKASVMGNGMVINLESLCNEMDSLAREGIHCNNLMISKDAHVIMPYHLQADKHNQSQANGGIGSTGKGIGPAYTDKAKRTGIRISDLYDKDRLKSRLEKAMKDYPESTMRVEEIMEYLEPFAKRIKQYVRDTSAEMHRFVREGKKIVLEGSQGLLLSIDHGTFPYVTSSDTSINGIASGIGISARMIDLPLGVVKFPFMTRVGRGPFPTEFGGARSEAYCGEEGHRKKDELIACGVPYVDQNGRLIYDHSDPVILDLMNSRDEFAQGIGLRLRADEFGATTGRPRRTGWTDAVSLRYAVGVNGPHLILTKADAIAGMNEFNVCYGYDHNGHTTETWNSDETFLRAVTPINRTYEGIGDIRDVRDFDKLPKSVLQSVRDLEAFTGGHVDIFSVGADRTETIVR